MKIKQQERNKMTEEKIDIVKLNEEMEVLELEIDKKKKVLNNITKMVIALHKDKKEA